MARSDILFVTDAECAARIGMSTEDFKVIAATLEKSGFPFRDPLFKNRRYWPAVRAYLDRRAGLETKFVRRQHPEVEDGKEKW